MNIAIFIGGLGTGGAQRVVCNLSNYLCKNNNVTIITLSGIESSYQLNKNVIHKTLERKNVNKNFIIKNINRIIELNKFIKREKQDVFISFLPIPSFILLLLKRNIKSPILVSVRNDPKVEYKSKVSNFLMRSLYPRADGFIFQTQDAKKYFDGIIKSNSAIIPNPINEDFVIDRFKGERKKVIVSVGRLAEQKNHALIIDAFSKISEKFNEYKLLIYGEGALRNKLEEQIISLGLNERVILCGNVKNLRENIYDSSLFIMSSNYEGMPNALMEAMSIGLPVISTDCPCGGPRFLIDNMKNGILVPVNDVDLMIEAIERVLDDNELSKNISKEASKISKTLNPTKIHMLWEEYINESVNKYKG